MKRFMGRALPMLLAGGLLAGCGTALESDTSVVYVDNEGKVVSLDVETLEQDYYDQEELTAFVKESVDTYTTEHGKNTVKLDSLNVKDGTAKLKMEYETTEDYSAFNGIELYQGRVVESLSQGYAYDGEFVKVQEGNVTGSASKTEIFAEEDLKVVIIKANTDVKIEGDICYVSCENVQLTGTDSVSIRDEYYLQPVDAADGNEQVLAYSTEEEEIVETNGSLETDVYTFIIYK